MRGEERRGEKRLICNAGNAWRGHSASLPHTIVRGTHHEDHCDDEQEDRGNNPSRLHQCSSSSPRVRNMETKEREKEVEGRGGGSTSTSPSGC